MRSARGFVAILSSLFLLWTITLASELPNSIQNEFTHEGSVAQIENPSLRGLVSSITQQELDHCYWSLEQVSKDGQVGREGFIIFIEDISGRSLLFEVFDDLPLSLVLIFYAAACFSGRECSSEEPSISLEHVEPSDAMLAVFCTSVKDVAVLQIEYKFQYQVRYPGWLSTENLLPGGAKDNLEEATQLVLLDHFGCESSQRRVKEELISDVIKIDADRKVKWEQAHRSKRNRGLGRRTLEDSTRGMQGVGPSKCDFNVHARISDIFDLGKLLNFEKLQRSFSAHSTNSQYLFLC
jgi:hypothetical protein